MEFTYTGTETIPEGTINLFCQDQNLTNLPENLPRTIERLWCHHNQLTSLPTLPENLRDLYCHHNQLTSLPELPEGLQVLNCADNQLTSLPELPEGLQVLNCAGNQLTSLPALPAGLRGLYCWNNQLTSLPSLANTNILKLFCENNPLPGLLPNEMSINRISEVINWQFEMIHQENKNKADKIKELEELTQKQQIIIEEMKMVPGYGEYYQMAEKRYEERRSVATTRRPEERMSVANERRSRT